MENNYYEEKLKEIKNLITISEFKEAYDLIQEELKMPYVPEIYEKQFDKILEEIKSEMIGDSANNSIPKEIVIEYLLSNDDKQESIALEMLRDHNVRGDLDVIIRRLESWPQEKNIMKAYLFELLVEQEIDANINFNGIKLNPKTTGSILENEEVKKTMEEIPNHFIKNPAASNMALDEFQRFLLITYPAVPEDGKAFAFEISQIVKSMFDENTPLTAVQKRIKELLAK